VDGKSGVTFIGLRACPSNECKRKEYTNFVELSERVSRAQGETPNTVQYYTVRTTLYYCCT